MNKNKKTAENICNKIKNIDKVLEKIAKDGAKLASQLYSEIDDSDVQVSVEKIANGYRIVARGEKILFIEFGTGVNTELDGGSNPMASQVKVPIFPGSYSESDEGQHTWSIWGELHNGDMTGYPYNNAPKHVMWDVQSEVNIMLDEKLGDLLK